MTNIPTPLLPKVRRPKDPFKGRHAIMKVSRNFMRNTGKEMDPLTFRIMCHGLSYPTNWSVRKCVAETGYNRGVVYRHLRILMSTGYAIKKRHPIKKAWGYRFIAEPESAPKIKEETND